MIANSITALPPPNTCDHQPILFQFKSQVKSQQPSHSTNYDFASGDYNRINSILSLTDWNSFFCGCVTVHNYWLKWLNYVHQLITDFITHRKVKKRKQKPVPAHIHRIINHRNKLWKKYRKCNNKQTKKQYCMARSRARAAIKSYISSKENRILNSKSTKSFYAYLKKKYFQLT